MKYKLYTFAVIFLIVLPSGCGLFQHHAILKWESEQMGPTRYSEPLVIEEAELVRDTLREGSDEDSWLVPQILYEDDPEYESALQMYREVSE